ncbi:hypothetical protein FDP41_005559 [Naegleria fowleri]|uniref:Uncharacterized protein n=1 Tax=Naegleria fowleri TaxID=5763 RepID=A0A6A5BQ62_NAEFO|nr:uncharacterized protein FDP41_005559 [Naegleria fowleri]KAF0975565.1 hypothetical protein FDP41_005559 [Naegleria fowleri]
MHPVVRSLEILYSMKKEIFEILQTIEMDFDIIILTLASHTVIHFPLSIFYLGPLWCMSTFMLEDLVGSIISSVQGGKNNMDHKALQNVSLHQVISMKRVRSFTFQFKKGDFFHAPEFGHGLVISKKDSLYHVKILDSNEVKMLDEMPKDAIPCFQVCGKFKQVYRNDLFLI